MDENLKAKMNLLVFLQRGNMEQALEKAEWLHSNNPSDNTIRELKRFINKRIQQLKVMHTETESSSSEDDDTETDEGYADAEFTNSSSGEEGDDEE